MFSSTSGAQNSEIAMYRLTDLHQPQTVNLLTTPVPKCPEDIKISGLDSWHGTPESLETDNVPEVTIKEVLNLLERVDIGFMCVYPLFQSLLMNQMSIYSADLHGIDSMVMNWSFFERFGTQVTRWVTYRY